MNTLQLNEIRKLSEMPVGESYVISLYLKLDPEERENFKYRITLKNLIQKTKDTLDENRFTREQLKAIEQDLERIESYFNDVDKLESCNGVAVFCSGLDDIWQIFKLPYVYRNRLVVDKHPLTGELLEISEESESVPFLLVDRRKARMFDVSFDNVEEVHDYIYPGASRTQKFQAGEGTFKQRVSQGSGRVSMGYGEYKFNRTIENDYQQHLKYVSDRIFDYYKETKFNHLIIGGNEHTIKDFVHHLHSYISKKLLGTVVLDIDTVKNDVLVNHTLDLLEQRKNRIQNEAIGEFEEKNSKGMSVSGIRPVIKAIMSGQVKTLLIEEGYAHEGFICPESRILMVEENKELCPESETPVRIADIVDLVTEEAFSQQSEVIVVDRQLADKIFEGIGAILRFKL